jgi:hypothetical protein
VRKIFKNHETLVLLNHDLEEADNVMVSEMLEQLDLSHGGDRESILFTFHSNFLEGNLSLGIDMDSFENLAIRASANHRLIAGLSEVDRISVCELCRKRRTGFRA